MHLHTHTEKHAYVCVPPSINKNSRVEILKKTDFNKKIDKLFQQVHADLHKKYLHVHTHEHISIHIYVLHNYTYTHVCVHIFMFFIFRKGFHLYYVPVCYSLCRLGWPRIQIYMPFCQVLELTCSTMPSVIHSIT